MRDETMKSSFQMTRQLFVMRAHNSNNSHKLVGKDIVSIFYIPGQICWFLEHVRVIRGHHVRTMELVLLAIISTFGATIFICCVLLLVKVCVCDYIHESYHHIYTPCSVFPWSYLV